MPLNSAQKQAVEYLDGPLLVLAGPGTGKTQLLSSKVEYILNNTDATPDSILCLTFTDSGAENMRSRLYSMIGSAAAKVRIYTYHAFGSTILAEYKNYATDFDRNLDATIDNVTQHKIIKSIQESLSSFDILRSANTSDIISTISSAKSARLTGKDIENIAKDNIATTEKLNPLLNAHLKNVQNGMKFEVGVAEVYGPIMETLAKFTSPEPIVGNIEKEANSLLYELNSIIETERAKEKPSISALTNWKKKRFEKDADGNYRLSNRIANKKLLSFSHIMQEYEKYLEDNGLYDFADMIEQAIKILKTDQGFKLTLEERYQYILLDEFQDTNTAQAELIYHLTDYEKPIVMAVGDDDQAIFAFQGANASNLLDFQAHYNAKVITLLENYRSQSEILETSYLIREQISESFAKAHNIIKKLIAKKPGKAQISRHEFLESSAEYHFIAEEIHRLIKSGVAQSQIAIITPKHKYVMPLLPYLKVYPEINISYEKRDNLFEDQKIHQILSLSRFVYELSEGRNPSALLLEVLSFPFFEIDPVSVVSAVSRIQKKPALDYLQESENEKLKSVGIFLAKLTTLAPSTPLELFLDYLVGTAEYMDGKKSAFLDFYSKTTDSYSTFELYENLSVLREAIIKHTTSAAPKLKDLINFVDDYESAEEPLVNTSPYQDSADSIQIITAHKSKGLEFEYVFLVAVDDRSWGNAKGNNTMFSLPQNLISIRHTGVTEDERLRLFFVALTRAKSHLYLTNSKKDFSGKTPARLEYLAEYEKDDKIISPYLPLGAQEVEKHYTNLPEDQLLGDLKTSWIAHYNRPDGNLREILLKRLENYRLTATDLTSFIDISYGGPQIFYKKRILRAPDESYSRSLTFGTLVHAVFEKVTNEKITDDEALKFYEAELEKASVPEEDIEELRERGLASLKASLKKFGELLRADDARAEVNLYHDHLTLDGVPLTGKIDHIHVDKTNKTIEIYDFKTSGFKDNKWESHPTLYKYSLQLGFYKLLLNLSPEFMNYQVTKAHILFVVPDEEAKVHDKVYEYNNEDEINLKNLISAVYSHIKTLDFLSNPELFIEPDSNRKLKDIKEFIKLVLDTTPKID
ncbi:ATP-dependent helicase [Candidatus Saccharibacteria bacterium]|nr:ATP-dependent helicase [Candidatus Saccharibacteria bacterium]